MTRRIKSQRSEQSDDILNITPQDVFTAAQYPIAQAAVAVSISGLEMLQNSGKEKMLDLLESRIGNAERTFQNNLSNDAYSNGKRCAVLKAALIDLESREADKAQAVARRAA